MEVLTGMPKDTFVGKPLGDVLKGDGLMTAVRKGDVRVPCQAVHMDTSLFGGEDLFFHTGPARLYEVGPGASEGTTAPMSMCGER